MLVFLRHKITFLATPKTGTTAVEMALKPRAEIVFSKGRKHITALRYANKIAPFLEDTFGVRPASVAVMREPVDQIRSWYKYRSQERLDGTAQSTKGISFDQFVREVVSNDPPERAQIGRQFNFLTDGKTQVMADHIFAYEEQEAFLMFLSEHLQHPVEIPLRNVSPKVGAALEPTTLALLQDARAADFILYDELRSKDGHLKRSDAPA
ncbi:Gamma-glutamyl kinase [Sulfitobacter noctilucicola]|uniref:Gamma-glutamyl kinase n=1 Tax=Sulfitobacter noctilucicola TaxID=1342301 RepID=A0A7W6M974_9RHOB|nr:hypothetical protein [Sulfitobacter noctilucicola]KIN63728.1 Gamma-glutamyl kinase [Sulfitobacter noctilucicola]MBB4174761.1 hypothetical protein [Sulfitobacter noctilucicola]